MGRLHGVKGGGVLFQKRHELPDAFAIVFQRARGNPSCFKGFQPQGERFSNLTLLNLNAESGSLHECFSDGSGARVQSAVG